MKVRLLALAATLALQPAFAESPQPSEKSVLQLLQVMHTHQVMENAGMQMDETMTKSMRTVMAQMQLTPEQEKIRADYQAKIVGIIKEALGWSTVEPLLVQAYQSTFTQEEVNAMLQFYDSPIGQSVGAKLPAVNQQISQLTQQRMQDVIPKIIEAQKEMAQRLKATSATVSSEAPAAQPAPH